MRNLLAWRRSRFLFYELFFKKRSLAVFQLEGCVRPHSHWLSPTRSVMFCFSEPAGCKRPWNNRLQHGRGVCRVLLRRTFFFSRDHGTWIGTKTSAGPGRVSDKVQTKTQTKKQLHTLSVCQNRQPFLLFADRIWWQNEKRLYFSCQKCSTFEVFQKLQSWFLTVSRSRTVLGLRFSESWGSKKLILCFL